MGAKGGGTAQPPVRKVKPHKIQKHFTFHLCPQTSVFLTPSLKPYLKHCLQLRLSEKEKKTLKYKIYMKHIKITFPKNILDLKK